MVGVGIPGLSTVGWAESVCAILLTNHLSVPNPAACVGLSLTGVLAAFLFAVTKIADETNMFGITVWGYSHHDWGFIVARV